MTLTGIFGFLFVLIFFGLMIIFLAAGRAQPGRTLREIAAFTRLRRAVGLAVEAGNRLHISTGWGNLTGVESAPALVGLTLLGRIARAASISDRPPIATSGNGELSILSRDTLRSAYRSLGAQAQYDPTAGRLVGLTPFSFAVGVMPVILDEHVSTNVLVGHFGSEIALINETADRNGSLTVAGTESLSGQAVLYASAQEPLIGEEVFAGGAYLGAGVMHNASLRAEDFLRLAIIVIIFIGVVLKLTGFYQVIVDLFTGILP